MEHIIHQNLFAILVASVGAVFDVSCRKVPNWLTFGTFAVALSYSMLTLSVGNIFQCLAGFIVGLILLILPYLLGGMGAGDVKLLAAIGSILGYKKIFFVFIYSTLGGLLIGLIWLISKPERLKFMLTTGQIMQATDKKDKVPYAVAILLGTISYISFGEGILFNL